MNRTMSMEPSQSSLAAMRVVVVAALSATTMLFASLVSAYFVRRSFTDWAVPKDELWPWVLLSLAIGVSVGLEIALRASVEGKRIALQGAALLTASYLVGALGVIGSMVTGPGGLHTPHRAFVALLLGIHVIHSILGGVFTGALLREPAEALPSDRVFLARLVTHFLAGLVLFIVVLLFVVR